MRVNLPDYYLSAISYLKQVDPSIRIASFPVTDFWGWQFNDWGYRGSGFIWYGIANPILSRTFDVWSPNNEEFYNELSGALSLNDVGAIKYVFNRYQVGYIIFDDSIFEPGDSLSFQKIQRQKDLLEESGFIQKEDVFGKITLYKVSLDEKIISFISAPDLDYSGPHVTLGKVDQKPAVKENFSNSQGYPGGENCSLMGSGSVVKKRLPSGNYYKAEEGGIECDYFYYPGLDVSKAYKLIIKGKNLSGRSLKFYLFDNGSENMTREELLPSGNFDSVFYIFPAAKSDKRSGYTLNVETRSFGKIKSENILTDIEFYPVEFSYSWANGVSNNLRIKDVVKFGTWGYKVDVEGSGVIQLGQGYETGWQAFSGITKLTHLEINGWANGWVVPPGRSTIYIFYLPQFLE